MVLTVLNSSQWNQTAKRGLNPWEDSMLDTVADDASTE